MPTTKRKGLPTRISVEPTDPGFAAYGALLAIGDVDVYLDGVRCKGVITADAAEGFVERYDGSVKAADFGEDEEWPTVVERGQVTIESRINPRTVQSRRATVLRLKGK